MLKVIDLKSSNISSIVKALNYLKVDFEIVTDGESLIGASKILLPGVGSFRDASIKLQASGIPKILKTLVIKEKVPILGICVGMHLLADLGDEGGVTNGLGLIKGHVKYIDAEACAIKVPHLGWNDIDLHDSEFDLFEDIPRDSCFYFAHSYEFNVLDNDARTAFTEHGKKITAYVQKNNIYGAQFHPEKSQAAGLEFLRNFVQ